MKVNSKLQYGITHTTVSVCVGKDTEAKTCGEFYAKFDKR